MPKLKLGQQQKVRLSAAMHAGINLLRLPTLELNKTLRESAESNPLLEFDDSSQFETTGSPSYFNNELVDEMDLKRQLQWQLQLEHLSSRDNNIGLALIDSINSEGFLTDDLSAIRTCLSDEAITLDEMSAVLHRIQHFEPCGVGARNWQECLLRQLEELPEKPLNKIAMRVVQDTKALKQLFTNRSSAITTKYGLTTEEVNKLHETIRNLHLQPAEYVSLKDKRLLQPPDMIAKFKGGQLQLEYNVEVLPKFSLNQYYVSLMDSLSSRREVSIFKRYLSEAQQLLHAFSRRQKTLLQITSAILEWQSDFFRFGRQGLKPLKLKDIAKKVGLHTSTVSRAIHEKTIATPRGVLPLKFFFTTGLSMTDHSACSSKAVQSHIKKLIKAENKAKPLSDQQIAGILQRKGIDVARRTVARYRHILKIPPSQARKTLL